MRCFRHLRRRNVAPMRLWRTTPPRVEPTPLKIDWMNIHMPDGSELRVDMRDPEWFVCKEHGHYIDSPEYFYVCRDGR